MKLEMVNAAGETIAIVEGAGKHGVTVRGQAAGQASDAVNACRCDLQSRLERVPNGDEIVAELVATDSSRFKVAGDVEA